MPAILHKGILKVLSMQTREIYRTSFLYKAFGALFVGKREFLVSESAAGKAVQKIYYPYISEICLFLSVFLFWYEGLVSGYMPVFANKGVASVLLVVGLLFSKKDMIKLGNLHFWYLGFLIISLVSAVFAVGRGVDAMLLISGWTIFAQFMLAVFLAQSIVKKERMLKALVFLSLPLAGTGVYQFLFNVKTSPLWLSSFETGIETRAFAFFGSPNVLGILLATMTVLSFCLYLKEKKKYYLFIAAVDMFAVGITFSRSAWIGLLAGILLVVLLYRPKVAFFSPLAFLLLFVPQIRGRIMAVFSDYYITDSSLDGRIWSFINGIHIFKKYPILGTGPGSYGGQLASQGASPVYLESIQNGYTALYFTDNQYLEILIQTGALGLLAFLGFVVCVFVFLIDKFKEKRDILMLVSLGTFACFLASGAFANVLEFGAVAVPMGIILGAGVSSCQSERLPERSSRGNP